MLEQEHWQKKKKKKAAGSPLAPGPGRRLWREGICHQIGDVQLSVVIPGVSLLQRAQPAGRKAAVRPAGRTMSPSALGDRTSGHKKNQQRPGEAQLVPCTHLQEEIPLH